MAAQVGGPIRFLAEAAWGECAYLGGDPAGLEVAEGAARAARLAPRGTPEVAQWSDPQVLYAELATWSERFVEAEDLLAASIAEAQRKRYPMTLVESQYHLVEVLCRTGRLDQALVAADQLLESAELMSVALPLAVAQKALVLLELGELEEAGRLVPPAGGHERRDRRAGSVMERGALPPRCAGPAPGRPGGGGGYLRPHGAVGGPGPPAGAVHLPVGGAGHLRLLDLRPTR